MHRCQDSGKQDSDTISILCFLQLFADAHLHQHQHVSQRPLDMAFACWQPRVASAVCYASKDINPSILATLREAQIDFMETQSGGVDEGYSDAGIRLCLSEILSIAHGLDRASPHVPVGYMGPLEKSVNILTQALLLDRMRAQAVEPGRL